MESKEKARTQRVAQRQRRCCRALSGYELSVALDSDFDGAVVAPFDTSGLPLITEVLLAEGFTEEEIRRIMGGKVIRFLRQSLP